MKARRIDIKYLLNSLLISSTIFCSWNAFSSIDLIAEAGQPAAGFPPGYNYESVFFPVIGSSGHVAFTGQAGLTKAVWSGLPDQLKAVIKESEAPIGFPTDVFFSSVFPTVFSVSGSDRMIVTKSGHVGIFAEFIGPGISSLEPPGQASPFGVMAYVGEEVHGLLLNGTRAPGLPPEYYILGIINFAFTDAGMVIKAAVYDRSLVENFVTVDQIKTAVWFWNFESLELIPSPIANCDYVLNGASPVIMNSLNINQSGTVVFSSGLGGDLCPNETFGIFRWDQEKTEMILASGDPVPEMPNTEFYWELDTANISFILASNAFSLSDQGEVAFPVTLRDTVNDTQKNSVWVVDHSDEIRLLLLEGESIAGQSFPLLSPQSGSPVIANGLSMLIPILEDSSTAILSGEPRSVQPYASIDEAGESQLFSIVKLNNQPSGFGDSWSFDVFTGIALNNAGQFIFSGNVTDANDSSAPECGELTPGIWFGTGSSDLEPVAYEGMPSLINGEELTLYFQNACTVVPGGNVSITSEAQILNSSSQGGRATKFNDSG